MDYRADGILEKILSLKHGESHYFNMFQGGGAVTYCCSGYYLLFEIPLYGGIEQYHDTYSKQSLKEMVEEALSWT
jgi:hypothetical protein